MARKRDPENEASRRQEMLTTCYRLLATRSHQSMTLEAVAKELGGSKGQIAHYYPSKEALIVATIKAALELHGWVLLTVAEEEGSLKQRLERLTAAALPDGPDLRERVAFVAEVWSFAKSSPEAAEAMRSAHAHLHGIIRKLLDIGVKAKLFSARRAQQLVVPVAALYDGLAMHGAQSDVDVEALRDHAKTVLVQLLGL